MHSGQVFCLPASSFEVLKNFLQNRHLIQMAGLGSSRFNRLSISAVT